MQRPLGLYPLPRPDGLTTEEVIQLLHSPSDDVVVVPCIPKGPKNNVYCLMDNHENQKREARGQNSAFSDDCGAWQTSKSKSSISPYVSDGQNGLKRTFWVASQQAYCSEMRAVGKRIYIPMDPQPSPDTVIKIKRYYVTLAASNEYRRRITTLVESNVMAEHCVAIIEYFGENVVGSLHGQNKDVKCENQSQCSSSSNSNVAPAEGAVNYYKHR